MSRQAVVIPTVEAALDEFFSYQKRTRGKISLRRFTRTAMASCARRATGKKLTPAGMSSYLARYRGMQDKTTTKYKIAGRGYGRAAHWYVLSGPGLPLKTSEGMVLAHAEWVSEDAARRCITDFTLEVMPGAYDLPMIKARVDATRSKIVRDLKDLVNDVHQDKALWEAAEKRHAEVVPAITDTELQLLAELNGGRP